MYALYARQSVEKQESISVESQLAFCRREIGGAPCREYVDRGYSGKNTDRPAFHRMLEDIRAGRIHTVVVYKLDRISRSILDFSNMIALFQAHQVAFISSTERFDTSAPIGRAMLNLCAVFAQLERETIQARVADAYHARAQKGLYMGGRMPYGFRRGKTEIGGVQTVKYLPVPEECDQLRTLFALYADPANSLSDLVRYLEAHGMRHLRGGRWDTARLSELLRNPVYVQADADVYAFFREQGVRIVNPPADFTGENACYLFRGESGQPGGRGKLAGKELVLAPHAGIIPSGQWLACRRRGLANSRPARTCHPSRSWLLGKVQCAACGRALRLVQSQTRWGRYLVCPNQRAARGPACCGIGGTVYAELLESCLSEAIGEKLASFPVLSEREEPSAACSPGKLRLAEIEDETAGLLERLPKANSALIDCINRRVEALALERQALLSDAAKQLLDQRSAGQITDHTARWQDASFTCRQAVADLLIDCIRIGGGTIEIRWKL